MRFTSVEARDEFARIVLRAVHPPDSVLDLADRISQRMTERSQGHLWMGAHMRRGDCTAISSPCSLFNKTVYSCQSGVGHGVRIGVAFQSN